MGLTVQTKTLRHCRDFSAYPRFKTTSGPSIGSHNSVPISRMGGKVHSVLNVSHYRPDFFNEWHIRLLLVWYNCVGQRIADNRFVIQMERVIEKRTVQLKNVNRRGTTKMVLVQFDDSI